jgi:hypothetical protein
MSAQVSTLPFGIEWLFDFPKKEKVGLDAKDGRAIFIN